MKIFIGAHSCNFVQDKYKHRVGNLFSPGGLWNSGLQYALDNYVFAAWRRGEMWSAERFVAHLEKAKQNPIAPLWVVCPDVVGDSIASQKLWKEWAPRLRGEYGWKLAFAVQDGQALSSVPSDADVIFVGGSTEWKRKSIAHWCENFPRVHVARVNTYRWLWYCHEHKAESIDGTGWFWAKQKAHHDLLDYLAITEGDAIAEAGALFPIFPYNTPMVSLS